MSTGDLAEALEASRFAVVAADRWRGGYASGSKAKLLHHVITSSRSSTRQILDIQPLRARISAAPSTFLQASGSMEGEICTTDALDSSATSSRYQSRKARVVADFSMFVVFTSASIKS